MFAYCLSHPQIVFIVVLLLALAATLYSQTRNLPLQNVLFVAALTALIAAIVETIGDKTGIPFGPFFYTDNLARTYFRLPPWPVPIIWIVVILNARGVVRLMLRPWRELPNYGLQSMALTSLLSVVFDAILEPFASRTQHFWIWQTPKNVPSWYGAPWINFISWAVVTVFILGFVTPWLINKKPVAKPPLDYHPLAIWLVLNLLLTAANAGQHLWWAVGFSIAANTAITISAWKNSRW